MNFIKVTSLVFNRLQTVCLLAGMLLIVIGMALLAGIEWGLITAGAMLIIIGLLINYDRERR